MIVENLELIDQKGSKEKAKDASLGPLEVCPVTNFKTSELVEMWTSWAGYPVVKGYKGNVTVDYKLQR